MGLAARLRGVRAWPMPADTDWRRARLCVVDVETTGLDLAHDEIVSIGAVMVESARITSRTFYEVVKPRTEVSEEAVRVHALVAGELADAPSLLDVLPRFKEFATRSVLVAHAAWIERAFLNRSLRPVGECVPEPLVDTAALARALDLIPPSDREPSLEGLARTLGMPVHPPHHALGDALTTAGLLLLMCSRLERTKHVRVSDLQRLSTRRRDLPAAT